MAEALEGVAADCAEREGGVAGSHEDWVGCMAEVVDACFGAGLVGAQVVTWGYGETEARGGHGVWEGFEGKDREAVR